jgi:hypothetical protein
MKKRGRPPKNGVVGPERFLRALKVIHAYSKAREEGQKHSAAVKEAVEFVRQLDPKKSISETEVKRVLAEFRPRDSQVALTAEFLVLEGKDTAGRRSFLTQNPELAGTKSATKLTYKNLRKPLKSFKFGFRRRPNYTRHNAKTSNS